jgi:hypothetical protein
MKMCFKILYFSRVRNWLGPIFSVAIIMIFVSCTNINKYVRNYQDCLTLVGSSEYRDFSNSDPFSSGRSA